MDRWHRRGHRWVAAGTGVIAAAGVLLAPLPPSAPAAEPPDDLRIEVVSNRADLISGGDALVAVHLPDGVPISSLTVRAGGRDVTDAFDRRPTGRIEGIVTGLPLGQTVLRATAADDLADRIVVTNHRNGGPVFSGPHVQPWVCQPSAVDELCNQPPTYEYFYQPTNPVDPGLKPYDRADPPADVATTTSSDGVTVPFVVRLETGYQDRDQYQIATLYQPDRRWRPWASQPQWNHKLLITHGGGCDVDYGAATAPSVLADNISTGLAGLDDLAGMNSVRRALGQGYAVLSTALNNNGHNCNLVTQAESLVMAKEHIVETYGPIRYTIGSGCSGGSITQQQVANAYPGIYQGLLVTCSFPDSWTAAAQVADYHLLRAYFEDPASLAKGWTPLQWGAVEGHLLPLNAIVSDLGYFAAFDPTHACGGVTDAERYHPTANPGGVRCSVPDYMVNVLGPRPRSVWTPMERAAGHGFAGIALGNVGVQYGLDSLRRGIITPAQFVDLNASIGGLDIDIQPTDERVAADRRALRNAYRSGAINEANNLDEVAIIDLRGPDPFLAHDAYRAWAMRARLEREHGHHDNHVIWFGAAPIIAGTGYMLRALDAMDRWLGAVESDESDRPLATKIASDRPGGLHDRCSLLPLDGVAAGVPGVGGLFTLVDLVVGGLTAPVCENPLVQTRFGTPRTVAGQDITTDSNECRLRPLRRSDYYPVEFTEAQWSRLRDTFPTGVCDYARPGVEQTDTIPWLTYQEPDGSVVYGGTRLGRAPRDSGGGWSSPSFDTWLTP
jgi:Tannase-like family of unknown function (DUF6351)